MSCPCNDYQMTRREFLMRGAVILPFGVAMLNSPAPLGFGETVFAAGGYPTLNSLDTDRSIVVVQLSGGNDGLNTVIPFEDPLYKQNRPTLGIESKDVLAVKNGIGLHPNLAKLKEIYDDGHLGVIQGAGYPNPNRSHFRSMEIWHTANPVQYEPNGWVGKYLDGFGNTPDNPLVGMNTIPELPQAMLGTKVVPPTIDSTNRYQWAPMLGGATESELQVKTIRNIYEKLATSKKYFDFLQAMGLSALSSSDFLKNAIKGYQSKVEYPKNSGFANTLKLVAQTIIAGSKTKVYYVSIGGFDTHAGEKNAHDGLMKILSEGLHAFITDLKEHGKLDAVAGMMFSEFGRRVKENGSRGTDHGAAAPMFVFGGKVRGSLYGKYPSLSDLQDGDLKYNVDFRQVYATLLQDWMGTDPTKILGGSFERLPLF